MIVVSAASGSLGRLVVDHLLSLVPADHVTVAVRDPAAVADLADRGVGVRRGDYDDPASLRTAFDGARRLLLISSPVLAAADRVRQHVAAVDAGHTVGVGAIAYTSFLGADRGADGMTEAHHATEQALLRSGLPWTMLRHPFYSEAFLEPALASAVDSGVLSDPSGGRGLNTAFRSDLAEAAARVLTGGDQHLGRAYDFTGPLWTYPQLADAIERVRGVAVVLREESQQAPGAMGWLHGLVRSGALESQTGDLQDVLGHPPTSLDQAVARFVASPARS
ncbi:NAD(P)H-binding protein [Streptomyces sp. NPDC091219]|uniref:NAD(P)H-binding protein n=1 Tax=Streptomyces sp. NPDC091219 TaxID=3155193 RepID=UPI00344DD1AF